MTGFNVQLQRGRMVESQIARWLMRHGFNILPVYGVEEGKYKGPQVFSATGNFVAPDLMAFRPAPNETMLWCECKSKGAFTWYRRASSYQDGVDKRHWLDYLKLRDRAPWPLWLFFLHAPGQVAKDNPPNQTPPVGLFGGEIRRLAKCIDHESDRWGKGGMVYWNVADLLCGGKPLAEWAELEIYADVRF